MDGEFNCCIWRGGDALLNQRVCQIIPKKDVKIDYLHLVIPKMLKFIEDNTFAVTVKHISVKQILDIKIPLPSSEEQQKILDQTSSYKMQIEKNIEKNKFHFQEIEDVINKTWGDE